MKIYQVTDPEFREYGRIIKGIDFSELLEGMEKTPCPDDVVYVASDPELEKIPVCEDLRRVTYGELPVQVGYCNGHNNKLNALEYHRSSEINIGATDFYLILARQADVTDEYTLDTSTCKVFYAPKGTAVEVFATSLHYAPCNTGGKGFRVVIVLPRGTNYDLEEAHAGGEDAHLTAKNKWLIGHPEGGLPEGSPMGLIGENITLE
ncbi:MAG: DUF4867 family protein [Lachnospiraceae bacterium]|nr:DUF4867 family protein [Lachnospiraceae bacterium]